MITACMRKKQKAMRSLDFHARMIYIARNAQVAAGLLQT